MRAFEDFVVGDIMQFGPLTVTAKDIRSFAERFDPPPLDGGATGDDVVDTPACGLHTVCLQMRLLVEGILADSTCMGSPGVNEIAYLEPVRGGDRLTLRVEVVSARPSRSRPEMGLVGFFCQLRNGRGAPALELTAAAMFGRRKVAGIDRVMG